MLEWYWENSPQWVAVWAKARKQARWFLIGAILSTAVLAVVVIDRFDRIIDRGEGLMPVMLGAALAGVWWQASQLRMVRQVSFDEANQPSGVLRVWLGEEKLIETGIEFMRVK